MKIHQQPQEENPMKNHEQPQNIQDPTQHLVDADTADKKQDPGSDTDDTPDNDGTPDQDIVQSEDTAQDSPGKDHPSREAANYRHRLRETEAERDALAAQVEDLQHMMISEVVAERVKQPRGFWAHGAKVADLVDEDGLPDHDKIDAAINEAIEDMGLEKSERTLPMPPVPTEGNNSRPPGFPSMTDVINTPNW